MSAKGSGSNAQGNQDGPPVGPKKPLGLAIGVLVFVVVVPFGLFIAAMAPWRVTRPIVNCSDLRSAETSRSEDLLEVSLTETLATTKAELDDVRSKRTEAEAELGEVARELHSVQLDLETYRLRVTTANAELAKTQDDEEASESGGSEPDVISLDDSRVAAFNESIASLTESVVSLSAAIEALDQRREVLLAKFEAKYRARSALLTPAAAEAERLWAQSEILALQGFRRVDGKDRERLEMMVAILVESVSDRFAFPGPRSDVNLVPAVSVVSIDLGAHRFPTRVEVALETLSLGDTENATADAGAVVISDTDLPDKAEFLTEAGQLRRTEGIAIPAQAVSVWARRLGNFVMLSVCITPDGLDAGQYAGDVYLLDPSLNPMKVHVEVTAQSVFINWLYVLLVLVPISALFYVWVNSRYTAGESPWKWSAFWKWLSENAVIALVVGFIAVWAALQGPFNNPTWGSSLVGSAAVIGVGLVAAMTAMTVVAGRARGHGIDSEDDGTDTQDEDAGT